MTSKKSSGIALQIILVEENNSSRTLPQNRVKRKLCRLRPNHAPCYFRIIEPISRSKSATSHRLYIRQQDSYLEYASDCQPIENDIGTGDDHEPGTSGLDVGEGSTDYSGHSALKESRP